MPSRRRQEVGSDTVLVAADDLATDPLIMHPLSYGESWIVNCEWLIVNGKCSFTIPTSQFTIITYLSATAVFGQVSIYLFTHTGQHIGRGCFARPNLGQGRADNSTVDVTPVTEESTGSGR